MTLNSQQERFAQSYVLHRNATDAAKAAGYAESSAKNQGYRLLQNDKIIERISDLEKELETDVDVIPEIEKQYQVAVGNKHTQSALKALELLSRVRGAKNEKADDTNIETLQEELVSIMKMLGKKNIDSLYKKCGF
jgi:phage terminase small subunit|tara:strand:- start:28 stop:435 length:408 start_codon:yes stop_codon:yes gene_type:complete